MTVNYLQMQLQAKQAKDAAKVTRILIAQSKLLTRPCGHKANRFIATDFHNIGEGLNKAADRPERPGSKDKPKEI